MKILKRERGLLVGRQGFTLIELLIVIAILGTLAVVVLIALNPLQQLARTRDAGRSSTITQLGHTLEAYAITHNGFTGITAGSWMDDLVTAGELNNAPDEVSNSTCTGTGQNNICYDTNGTGADAVAVIWTDAEATSNKNRCDSGTGSGCVAGVTAPVWAYSTVNGRGGLVCATSVAATSPDLSFCDE